VTRQSRTSRFVNHKSVETPRRIKSMGCFDARGRFMGRLAGLVRDGDLVDKYRAANRERTRCVVREAARIRWRPAIPFCWDRSGAAVVASAHIRARVSLPRGSGRRAARLRGAVGLRAPGRRTVVAPEGLGVGGVTVLAVRSGAPAARLPSYIPCKSINARSLTGAGVVELEISS